MKDIVIFGCGGVGSYVAHAINEINRNSQQWNILGFLDDDKKLKNVKINGYPVIGTSEWLREKPGITIALAIADPRVKKELVDKFYEYGCDQFATIIHPHTWIADSVTIGEGSIIYPGTTINVNSIIGKFAMVNMNCAIGHDVEIKDFAFLAPNVGVGGNSLLSTGCSVGIGASVIQHVTIGAWATIGAGAVVIREVNQEEVVVGNPAKPLKYKDSGENFNQ